MLNIFYMIGIDLDIAAASISGLGVIVAVKKKKKLQVIAVLSIILLFAVFSVGVHIFYTKIPDIVGDTLYEAHHSLRDSDLFFDDATEQIFMDNLGTSGFLVQTQEPESGVIVRKNSVVTVTVVEITDPSEAADAPPIQDPGDTDTSSISKPTQDTADPAAPAPTQGTAKPATPTPTRPNSTPNSNSTPDNNSTDTGDHQPAGPPIGDHDTNDPYSDPAFNGNADVGGGVNSDNGTGDFQPQDPSTTSHLPEQEVISGTIPEPW